jgi:methionyl-tRNA synthetase
MQAMDEFKFSNALDEVWQLISRSNKYIDETAPWILAKDDSKKAELDSVLAHLAESLRVTALMIQPVMPNAPKEMFAQLGLDFNSDVDQDLTFGVFPANTTVVAKGEPIFPRLDTEEEVAYIKAEMTKEQNASKANNNIYDPTKTELINHKKAINFETFDKSEIRVAEIINVDKVENADKLLKFELDAGDEGHRQILSGIAEFYPNYKELVGKKVLAVTNLKPRKLKGEVSQGMLLSSEHGGKIQLIFVGDNHENGADVG